MSGHGAKVMAQLCRVTGKILVDTIKLADKKLEETGTYDKLSSAIENTKQKSGEKRKQKILDEAKTNNPEALYKAGIYMEEKENDLQKALYFFKQSGQAGHNEAQKRAVQLEMRVKMFQRRKPSDSERYFNRAISKHKLKDYKGAIEDYTKAIEIDPYYSAAYNNRELAKTELKENKGLKEDYTKSIEINTNDSHAYNNKEQLEDLYSTIAKRYGK